MQSTLQTHMKTPKIQDFPQNYTVWAFNVQEYTENSETFDVIFPKNWEICKILCTTNHKSNIIVVENSEKSGFSTNSKQIFTKYLLFYM